MLHNPLDTWVLLVPLFQVPNSATTSFWMAKCFILHIAPLLLLKKLLKLDIQVKFTMALYISDTCTVTSQFSQLNILHSIIKTILPF